MANIFHVKRADNEIIIGTTDTSVYLKSLTATSVPFIDTGGLIAEDSQFTWEKASNYLTIQNLKIGGSAKLNAVTSNANHGLTLNAKGTSGVYFNYVDGGSGGVYFYNGTTTKFHWFGGTTYGTFRTYDEDAAEWLQFSASAGAGFIDVKGATPGILYLQNDASADLKIFQGSTSGETKSLSLYGYKAGDSKRALSITVGGTADDTVDFTGLSNYKFGGVGEFTGLTITGNSVFGLNSSVFQPTTDSTTFFQVLDADGGTPIFNVDTTNERVGIGTNTPDSIFHIKANVAGTVGSHPAGQLIIQDPDDTVFGNAVITGYESDGAGNPDQQLWYLGSSSSSNSAIIFLNRRNSKLQLGTNGVSQLTILGDGKVGIGVTDPHSKLEVNGAISSATSTFSTEGPTDDVDVSGINTLFLDTSGNSITIGGFAGGVDGQVLYVVRISNANNAIIEHNETGATQKIFLHAGADETLGAEYGGWIFICHGGTDWHDCSHAKHVP